MSLSVLTGPLRGNTVQIVKVMTFQLVSGKSMLYIRSVVIEPYFFGGLTFGEEKYVGLYALGIEYACR